MQLPYVAYKNNKSNNNKGYKNCCNCFTFYCRRRRSRRGTFCRPVQHSFPAGTLSWLALLLNARKLLTAEASDAASTLPILYFPFSERQATNCAGQTYCKSANSEHKMRWKSFISEIICPGTTTRHTKTQQNECAPQMAKWKKRKKGQHEITAERHRETKKGRERDSEGSCHRKATGQNKAAPEVAGQMCWKISYCTVITTLRKTFFLCASKEICASIEKYATLFFNGSRVVFMSKKLREKNE